MTTNVYPRTLGWYAVLMATRILVGVIVACIFLPNSGRGRTLGQSEEKHGGAPVVTLCHILEQPAKYDSKEVITYGVAGNSFHQTDYFEPECSLPKHGGALRLRFDDSYKLGHPEDKKYLRLLKQEGAIHAKFRGYFVPTGG